MATLDPEFDLRLRGALTAGKEAGRGLNVISGYRSPADQARAINSVSLNVNKRPASFLEYARGIKGYAAPVGGSMHQKGLAADLEGDVPWMRENARRYGLRFPESLSKTDPNHVEIDPNAWGPFQDPRDREAPSVTVPQSMGGVVGMLGPAPGSFRAAQSDQPVKSAAPAVAGMTQGTPPMAGAGMLGTWTPDEVNARRRMAMGMLQEGTSYAPVAHPLQGVARVIQAAAGAGWMDQANTAQREGMAAGAQTMQAALAGGDPKAAIGGMLANPWTQDQGQKLATGMLASQIESQTPDAKLAREARQFELDNKRAVAPLNQRRLEQDVSTGDIDLELKKRELTSPKNSFQKLGPGDVLYQVNPRTGAVERVAGTDPGLSGPYKDPKQKADVEEGLRKEVTGAAKNYNVVREAATSLGAIAKNAEAAKTGASDMAMVFSFMKILDPDSVVREAEYANAARSAGVPDRMVNVIERVLSGKFLTPEQRKEFLGVAQSLATAREESHRQTLERYRGISGRLQVDPRNVLPDAPGPQQAPPLKVGDIVDNHRYLGGDPSNSLSWEKLR